jgi:tight adherence protein C
MTELTALAASPVAMITLATAVSVFLGFYAVSSLAAVKRVRLKRVRVAAARSDRAPAARGRGQASDDAMAVINRLIQRVNVMRDKRGDQLAAKLARAGWRSKDAVSLYLFGKLALPLAAGATAGAYLFLLVGFGLPLMAKLAGLIAAALVGSHLPELIVKNKTAKRAKAIQRAMPDALDLMVICAEAGLSLDASFKRVAHEIKPACPELADEYALTLLELRFMPERRRALEHLADRVNLPGMTALVNTLFQTEKFGTPLAQALRVLAAEMREQRMMKAEEKAARLPALMTIPLILFILPALFIVLMGPAGMDIAAAFSD